MESLSEANSIHVSWDTWQALGEPTDDPRWFPTNGVEAKGLGSLQTMMWRER